jgi:predicted NBD/HSP70 family sugar kinase
MAKALLGYATGTDPRMVHRMALENRSLRQRVNDLEEMVARLQVENDALAAVAAEAVDSAVARDGSLAHT